MKDEDFGVPEGPELIEVYEEDDVTKPEEDLAPPGGPYAAYADEYPQANDYLHLMRFLPGALMLEVLELNSIQDATTESQYVSVDAQ